MFPIDLTLEIDLVKLNFQQKNLPLCVVGVGVSGVLLHNNIGLRGRMVYQKNLGYTLDATYLPLYHAITGIYGVYASEPGLALFVGALVLSNVLVWYTDTKLIQEVLEKKCFFPVFFAIFFSSVYGYPCA